MRYSEYIQARDDYYGDSAHQSQLVCIHLQRVPSYLS